MECKKRRGTKCFGKRCILCPEESVCVSRSKSLRLNHLSTVSLWNTWYSSSAAAFAREDMCVQCHWHTAITERAYMCATKYLFVTLYWKKIFKNKIFKRETFFLRSEIKKIAEFIEKWFRDCTLDPLTLIKRRYKAYFSGLANWSGRREECRHKMCVCQGKVSHVFRTCWWGPGSHGLFVEIARKSHYFKEWESG